LITCASFFGFLLGGAGVAEVSAVVAGVAVMLVGFLRTTPRAER
jgi:hypothetical protein